MALIYIYGTTQLRCHSKFLEVLDPWILKTAGTFFQSDTLAKAMLWSTMRRHLHNRHGESSHALFPSTSPKHNSAKHKGPLDEMSRQIHHFSPRQSDIDVVLYYCRPALHFHCIPKDNKRAMGQTEDCAMKHGVCLCSKRSKLSSARTPGCAAFRII